MASISISRPLGLKKFFLNIVMNLRYLSLTRNLIFYDFICRLIHDTYQNGGGEEDKYRLESSVNSQGFLALIVVA